MNYRVRLTETAVEDLREIAFWIAEQSGEKQLARDFVSGLRAECQRLAEFPKAGALPKDRVLRSMDYRYITHKGYLIFYAIDEAEKIVHVLAIFNARKDYLRVMRRFL